MISKLKESFYFIILKYIAYNIFIHLKRIAGISSTSSGATHANFNLQESLAYIQNVFSDYKHYGDVKNFYSHVAEIGPGDNFGVGFLCLNDGAKTVTLLDRFYSKRDVTQQNLIYDALGLSSCSRLAFDGTTSSLENTLNYKFGEQASANVHFKNHPETYDFIISRSVLEHVDDAIGALKDMLLALKPCGKLIHKIDLRDHGMFSPFFYDTKFFEVPKFLYKLMTYGSGYPNRCMFNEYCNFLKTQPYHYEVFVTNLAGYGEINPHLKIDQIDPKILSQSINYISSQRGKFCSTLKEINPTNLIPLGVFLIIEKK